MPIVALHDRAILSLLNNQQAIVAIPSLQSFQARLKEAQKGCGCHRGSKLNLISEEVKRVVSALPAESKQALKQALGYGDKTVRIYQRTADNKVISVDF